MKKTRTECMAQWWDRAELSRMSRPCRVCGASCREREKGIENVFGADAGISEQWRVQGATDMPRLVGRSLVLKKEKELTAAPRLARGNSKNQTYNRLL